MGRAAPAGNDRHSDQRSVEGIRDPERTPAADKGRVEEKVMGVYIKGMEMPKTAFDCSVKVNPEERQCVFTHKTFEETLGLLTERRCADCPLVEIKEPHGRLIDGDKLHEEVFDCYSRDAYDKIMDIVFDIVEAPTVIEAEGKMAREEAIKQLDMWAMSGNAVPVVAIHMAIEALRNQLAMEWIPINEKAPEGDKVVLVNVITKDSDYEVICMRAYETRSAYEVGWVNAWMPLPEPYKEGKQT